MAAKASSEYTLCSNLPKHFFATTPEMDYQEIIVKTVGFEHHVAINPSQTASAMNEALGKLWTGMCITTGQTTHDLQMDTDGQGGGGA